MPDFDIPELRLDSSPANAPGGKIPVRGIGGHLLDISDFHVTEFRFDFQNTGISALDIPVRNFDFQVVRCSNLSIAEPVVDLIRPTVQPPGPEQSVFGFHLRFSGHIRNRGIAEFIMNIQRQARRQVQGKVYRPVTR